MYRNIVYKIDRDDNWQGKIYLFTWDNEGNPVTQLYPHNSYLYYEDTHGKDLSIFGTKIKRKEFSNTGARKHFIEKYPLLKYYEVEPATREFLKTLFSKNNFDADFCKYPLRTHFIDVEVAVEDEFPEPEKARYPINVITIYDTFLKKYFCWTDKKVTIIRDDVILDCCDSEVELLDHFLRWFSHNYPDILSGWNSMFFDVPYIINRLEKILPDGESLKISPVRNYYKKARLSKNRKESCYCISGISHLDYLILYRDKFMRERKFSYRLDAIAKDELSIGKIEYEGQFKHFYKKNFQKFVEYNIRDVEILVLLEEKKKYIELARRICNFGLCEYEAIYSSIPYIYNAIKLFQHKTKFLGFPAKEGMQEDVIEEQFVGAFVKDPIVGVYKRGIATIDLNSLYPNTIIALNLSPETVFGKIVGQTADMVHIKTKDRQISLKQNQYKYLLETKCTKSANDVLCFKDTVKKGIIPKFLEWLYNERKKIKHKLSKARNELSQAEENKDDTTAKSLKLIIQNLDTTQDIYKCFLNSIYGMQGSKYCPIFNLDNAEAITKTGQYIIKSASDFIDKYFKDNFGATHPVVCYNDTDSAAFDCQYIVDKIVGKENLKLKKNIHLICKELDSFTKIINNFCFEEIVKKKLYSNLDTIEFKRETFSTEGVFLIKKRYILHVRDKEGNACDEFKVVGYDTKKTEIPLVIRDKLQNIIEKSLVENWDYSIYKSHITSLWEYFKTLSLEDISIYKGYSTYKESTGFLSVQKGAGIHFKAATYYNQLVEKFGIMSQYDQIKLGDRLRYCYINSNNKYGIEAIGFLDKYPMEFSKLFQPDYKTMFHKVVLKPLRLYCAVQGWQEIDPTNDFSGDVTLL